MGMEELDSIVERAEHSGSAEGTSHGTGVHDSPALGSVHAAGGAPTKKVLSPSDLFLQMRQVDEGASRPSQETSPTGPQALRPVDNSRSTPEEPSPMASDIRQAVRERVGAATDT